MALTNEDNETAIAELARSSQLNPVVLYFSAVAQKNIGNNDEAVSNAEKAANKNTLSANLPFFRAEALALITELTSG